MRQPCVHFWIITDDGRRGKCKYCGTIRIYPALSDQWPAVNQRIKAVRKEIAETHRNSLSR